MMSIKEINEKRAELESIENSIKLKVGRILGQGKNPVELEDTGEELKIKVHSGRKIPGRAFDGLLKMFNMDSWNVQIVMGILVITLTSKSMMELKEQEQEIGELEEEY
jgi:hypothetical protein